MADSILTFDTSDEAKEQAEYEFEQYERDNAPERFEPDWEAVESF